MNLKRMTAVMMVATMVLGSAVTAYAADGAVGQGTSFDHVNKEITSVTLPLDNDVATVFNFYVDPEGLIKGASKLTNGTTVSGNDDGVYFGNDGGTYSSTSDEVEFQGANSVDVDVTVAASVVADNKSIALVETEEELAAATTPALLMKLTVGDDEAVITDDGATAKAKIEGKADNFKVVVKDSKYAYEAKANATGWSKTSVKLSGKTNSANVPDGEGAMTAPKIVLTWSVAQHTDAPAEAAPSISVTDYSYTSGSALEVSVNLGGGDLAATGISRITYVNSSGTSTALSTDNWSFANGKITIAEAYITALAQNSVTRDYKVTFNDTAATQVVISLHP